MKSVVTDPHAYDWEGDVPLKRPWSRTVIYEMHARGFTAHLSFDLRNRNVAHMPDQSRRFRTFSNWASTAVELLPVFQFDPQDAPRGGTNNWGYSPVSSIAPHQAYSSRQDSLVAVDEFRDMVKALHRAGIEVILDVVFNHTASTDDCSKPDLGTHYVDNATTVAKTQRIDNSGERRRFALDPLPFLRSAHLA